MDLKKWRKLAPPLCGMNSVEEYSLTLLEQIITLINSIRQKALVEINKFFFVYFIILLISLRTSVLSRDNNYLCMVVWSYWLVCSPKLSNLHVIFRCMLYLLPHYFHWELFIQFHITTNYSAFAINLRILFWSLCMTSILASFAEPHIYVILIISRLV